MFKERDSSRSWDLSELSFGLLGLVEQSKEKFHKLKSVVEGRRIVESAHKNWDNTNYCRSLSQDAPYQYSYQQLLDVFPANFRTFTDEYCLGTPIQEYPLAVDSKGMSGLDDTYQEPLAAQAKRFQEKLGRTGKRQQRSQIESFNSQRLDNWLATVCDAPEYAIGTKLVWCSPPGFRAEGYHGTSAEHHSFIWVYEKKMGMDGPEMTMTQFRCWPSLVQMEGIQRQLRAHSITTSILDDSGLQTHKLSRRNAVIADFIELPPEYSMDSIAQCIYETESSWKVGRTEMPQLSDLNRVAFAEYRDAVLHQFLLPTYQSLLAPMYQLQEPYDSPFWTSTEYRQLIQELDLSFAIAWQHLLKYVEAATDQSSGRSMPKLEETIPELHELFRIKVRSQDGVATVADEKRFNVLAPQILSAGSKAMSVGQCGLGTLIPLQLFRGLERFNIFRGITSVSQLSKFDVARLTAAEKLLFKEEVLGQYQPMTLLDRFGRKAKYWVHAEHYQEYLEGSRFLPTGECVGPCDIPLDSGIDQFVLTDSKFRELYQATAIPNLDALAQLDLAENTELARPLTEQERENIQAFYAAKRKKLKDRVSVTELLNNDLFRATYTRV